MQFGRIPLLSKRFGRGRLAAGIDALAVLACLPAVGLAAVLVFSTIAMASGQECEESSRSEVETCLNSQDRISLRACNTRTLDTSLARHAVTDAGGGRFRWTQPPAARTFVHLVGSGIKLRH